MSLAHAILGMLHDEPRTGYDLKTRCFDQRIAHFWPADQAQIYRTLDKMLGEGWVEYEIEEQNARPNRKVYQLTRAGETELHRWLDDARLDLPAVREPFLVQLFFAHLLPDAHARTLLLHQRAHHAERLAGYERVPLPTLGTKGLPREHQFGRMTLELGIAQGRATLAWIDVCIAHLDRTSAKAGKRKQS